MRMPTAEAVFEEVAKLVAAGEYRDEIPGVPGEALEGGGWFRTPRDGSQSQRLYERGSAEYIAAKSRGLIDLLPPLTPASPAAVAEIETLVGSGLPSLLRRLYLEVGNGGFGPGYGMLGLAGGHTDDGRHTATDLYRAGTFPAHLLPLCYWGCAIYSLLDIKSGEMWGLDPNPVGLPHALFPQSMTLSDWLGRWVAGRLQQPWAVEDPNTGLWRGATDAEYEAALADT
jgi:hypothetical protein